MLPLLLYAVLFGGAWAAALGLAAQLALACAAALLPLPRYVLVWTLFGVLALLLIGGVAEREASKYSWQTSDKAGLGSALRSGDRVSGYGFRSWNAAGVDAATLSLDVRLVSGVPAWDWFRSDPRYVLERQTGPDYPHTRVRVPGTSGDAPPFLMRTFDFRRPLGGRIFRVLLELRRADGAGAVSTASPQVLAAGPGNPIGGRDCEGISLQAWAYRGGGRCLPVTLTDDWQSYSLSWRVPEEVEASVVRVVVGGFAGETFDVRRVRLIGAKRKLGPLTPQGGAAEIAWGGRPAAQSGKSFIPGAQWRTVRVKASRGDAQSSTLTALVQSASGLVLETRDVTVTGPDGAPLPRAVSGARQTIVFGDPNLAGHTLGTLGLALVTLASAPLGALGGVLTMSGVVLTGSRAALIGVAFGLLWLFWLRLPQKHRRAGLIGAALLAASVGVGLAWSGSALRVLSLGESTTRLDIWAAAARAFVTHPWRGLGAGGFPAYWSDTHGGEAVLHAHNLWLEFAVSYGVLGLASALGLTLTLVTLAWRWGGARALALVGGTLVMNVFDTTLLYAGVLFPLLLALGSLKGSLRAVHLPLERPTHNAGVTHAKATPPRLQVPRE